METETIYGLVGFGLGFEISYAYFRYQFKNQVRDLLNQVNSLFGKASEVDRQQDRFEVLLFRDYLLELRKIMIDQDINPNGVASYKSLLEKKLLEVKK